MKEREEICFNVSSIVGLSKQLPREKQADMACQLLKWLEQSGIPKDRLAKIKQGVQEGLGLCLHDAADGEVVSAGSTTPF